MQEQEIVKSIYYFAIQNSYSDIQLALLQDEILKDKISIDKILASKDLICKIDFLLKKNNLKCNDLNFIAVNQGPAPFTTLRVVITTVNALNFASSIPLIGIDGLDAFINEQLVNIDRFEIVIALLNAFNNDVYFAIYNGKEIKKGWQNIEILLNELKLNFSNESITFIGNGADLFKNEIHKTFHDKVKFIEPNPQICSIESIAKTGLDKWKNKTDIKEQITPLYLKDAVKSILRG